MKQQNEDGMDFNSQAVTRAFASTLKKLRDEKNLTQHQLTDSSGLSLRMISDLERGVRQPSLGTMYKIAVGLGMTLPTLMEYITKELKNNN